MRTVTIQRLGGLGDVCMALCAAHAAKAAGCEVYFVTAPEYQELADACPHVDLVLDHGEDPIGEFFDLGPAFHGLAQEHQVVSFCRAMGIKDPSPFDLSLDLRPTTMKYRMTRAPATVLLHPGTGDWNRTVPPHQWDALVAMLIHKGFSVGIIGRSRNPDRRSVYIPSGNVLDLTDLFSPLELVDFLRGFNPKQVVLVSNDSGPIQLAGATEIGIVGLYSVAPGRWRLPHRNGSTRWRTMEVVPEECLSAPCYRKLGIAEIEAGTKAGLSLGRIFGEWCPEKRPACFPGIRIDRIVSSIEEYMS